MTKLGQTVYLARPDSLSPADRGNPLFLGGFLVGAGVLNL